MSNKYELHFEPWSPYRPLVTITKEDMAVISIYHKHRISPYGFQLSQELPGRVVIRPEKAIDLKVEAMQLADDFLHELINS